MNKLDEEVLAIIKQHMDQRKTLTIDRIENALPSVEKKEIKASLQRLHDEGIVVGWPLNAPVPYKKD